MTPKTEMEAALEAILFVASEPLSRERLLSVFDEGERQQAAEALDAVLDRYRRAGDDGGLLVDEAAGGVRLVTRPELHGYLRRFYEVSGKNKLSMAALETLAIVAYRQPVTAPEIQELRGVVSTGVLKTLLERRLVRIAGRKEVVGKPFLYATTKEFLLHFGLQNLKDLPPLEEFEDALSAEGASFGLTVDETDREEDILKQAALLAELEDGDSDAVDSDRRDEAVFVEQFQEEPETRDGEFHAAGSRAAVDEEEGFRPSYLADEEMEEWEAGEGTGAPDAMLTIEDEPPLAGEEGDETQPEAAEVAAATASTVVATGEDDEEETASTDEEEERGLSVLPTLTDGSHQGDEAERSGAVEEVTVGAADEPPPG